MKKIYYNIKINHDARAKLLAQLDDLTRKLYFLKLEETSYEKTIQKIIDIIPKEILSSYNEDLIRLNI